MNENNEEKDIIKMIDTALETALEPVVEAVKPQYADAEEYRVKTNKRFRLTKEEIATHGSTPQGRQAAFLARQVAGKL